MNDGKEARLHRRLVLADRRVRRRVEGRNLEYVSSSQANLDGRISSAHDNGNVVGDFEDISETRIEGATNLVQGGRTEPWNFGGPSNKCQYCGAIVWYEERNDKSGRPRNPKFSICCLGGRVQLPLLSSSPSLLDELLNYQGSHHSKKFRENIRAYNSIFAFTSIGGQVDYKINNGSGPYVFKLNGQNHHRIGSLLPIENRTPKFAQLYIYDTENEVNNRIRAISGDSCSSDLDVDIVHQLLSMFDDNNHLAQVFRMARERYKESELRPVRMRLLGNRSIDSRQYNLPVASEIAAIIVGNLEETNCERDIVVEHKCLGLQRILDLHK